MNTLETDRGENTSAAEPLKEDIQQASVVSKLNPVLVWLFVGVGVVAAVDGVSGADAALITIGTAFVAIGLFVAALRIEVAEGTLTIRLLSRSIKTHPLKGCEILDLGPRSVRPLALVLLQFPDGSGFMIHGLMTNFREVMKRIEMQAQ